MSNWFAVMQGQKAKQSLEVAPTTEKFVPHIARHPFTVVPVLPLTLGSYDGLSDPDDILQKFEGTARIHSWGDAVACHMLPIVLQGVAMEWFNNLPAQSITGFVDLRSRFLLNFHNLRARKRTHVECHDIKQKSKESLGEIIDRYTKEVAKIQGLPESQKGRGLESGKRYGGNGQPRSGNYHNDKYRKLNNNKGGGSQRFKSSHTENVALIKDLTKTPKEILATEAVCKSFDPPVPLSKYGNRDKRKFCDFHDDYGHETNECRHLIERVVAELKRGRLQHLKKSVKAQADKPKGEKEYPWQRKRIKP
ncbi:uncharacterized protein [Rutidosis leptorrhynchoides]|uniref:uncharacterized protein n=1 Tax=Rutidosis leptorrhynchoides TaxID=125765 RepID=UPI003A9A1171